MSLKRKLTKSVKNTKLRSTETRTVNSKSIVNYDELSPTIFIQETI